MTSKLENPWEVNSLYVFQYFNCPSCILKVASKQDFVYHAFSTHPESTEYFKKISDGSLGDILLPWESNGDKIKIELKDDGDDHKEELDFEQKVNSSCSLSEFPSQEMLVIKTDDCVEDNEILDKQDDLYDQSDNDEEFSVEEFEKDHILKNEFMDSDDGNQSINLLLFKCDVCNEASFSSRKDLILHFDSCRILFSVFPIIPL